MTEKNLSKSAKLNEFYSERHFESGQNVYLIAKKEMVDNSTIFS